MFEPPCLFRQMATAALDQAGAPWAITFTTPSLGGLWAAIRAGLGVTPRMDLVRPPGLVNVGEHAGLPALPEIKLCLHGAGRPLSPAAERLRETLLETCPFGLHHDRS
jgi:DNA-binding transcriptional LysR family regulator